MTSPSSTVPPRCARPSSRSTPARPKVLLIFLGHTTSSFFVQSPSKSTGVSNFFTASMGQVRVLLRLLLRAFASSPLLGAALDLDGLEALRHAAVLALQRRDGRPRHGQRGRAALDPARALELARRRACRLSFFWNSALLVRSARSRELAGGGGVVSDRFRRMASRSAPGSPTYSWRYSALVYL